MNAYPELAAEAAALVATRTREPVLLGITGGVGVGKSTTAARVREHLENASVRVEVLSTDAFLLPNHVLEQRSLTMRKGFPESFDLPALDACLRGLRAGAGPVTAPVYSHVTYDRAPGKVQVIEPADVVIIEGVNALQAPVADHLDLAVYIDAGEDDMRAWFVERFVALCKAAIGDEGSFYRGFSTMSVAEQEEIAAWTWREINAVNLHDHIAPSKARATRVLSKQRDHSLRSTSVPNHEDR